jgi:hypothetical protein
MLAKLPLNGPILRLLGFTRIAENLFQEKRDIHGLRKTVVVLSTKPVDGSFLPIDAQSTSLIKKA